MNICLRIEIAIADENCILKITSENSSENRIFPPLAVFSVSKPVQTVLGIFQATYRLGMR